MINIASQTMDFHRSNTIRLKALQRRDLSSHLIGGTDLSKPPPLSPPADVSIPNLGCSLVPTKAKDWAMRGYRIAK